MAVVVYLHYIQLGLPAATAGFKFFYANCQRRLHGQKAQQLSAT